MPPAALHLANGNSTPSCACEDDANEFIRKYFCDCIYNLQDGIAFALGLISIGFWVTAQVPQLIENYRHQKAEALSAWFLVDWLMGDTCNLIGCIASGNQLATQMYTAMYYVLADTVVLMQYLYYRALNSRKYHEQERLRQRAQHANSYQHGDVDTGGEYQPLPSAASEREVVRYMPNHASEINHVCDSADSATRCTSTPEPSGSARALACISGLVIVGILGHQSGSLSPVTGRTHNMGRSLLADRPDWVMQAGEIIGYLSAVFYIKGRISQIYLNFIRQSTEGLSVLMFLNAVCGNVTYGLAILLRLNGKQDFMDKLPWLIGSLGTVFLDSIILLQEKTSSMHLSTFSERSSL